MANSRFFTRFAGRAAHWAGHPLAFGLAAACILVWAVLGPIYHFSDTWQLVINTATTIITFLMVFLIQNTQNRDSFALQIKLDELIRATKGAHNTLLDIEHLSEEEIKMVLRRYEKLAQRVRQQSEHGRDDTDTPAINPANPQKTKRHKAS